MGFRRALSVLLLTSIIAVLVAGCATPRTQSPAESTNSTNGNDIPTNPTANSTTNSSYPTQPIMPPTAYPDTGGVVGP